MCVAGDEESNESSSSTGGSSDSDVPEIVVTAPRLGLNMDVIEAVDWSDVATVAAITGAGSAAGGAWSALGAAISSALATIETQDGIDLDDLVEVKDDLIFVRGAPVPYVSLH